MRLIPGKVKVKMELFKGVGLVDILIGVVIVGLAVLMYISNLPGKLYVSGAILVIGAFLLFRLDGEANYQLIFAFIKFLSLPKKYSRALTESEMKLAVKEDEKDASAPGLSKEELKKIIEEENKILKSKTASEEEKDAVWLARANRSAAKKQAKANSERNDRDKDISMLIPYTGIKENCIEYNKEYISAVLEVTPVDFRFFSQFRRKNSIETFFGKILRGLHDGYSVNIVKLERPINYERYLNKEKEKLEELRKSFEQGMFSEAEFKSRVEIEFNRIEELNNMCNKTKVIAPHYYLVFHESDRRQLELTVRSAMNDLEQGEVPTRRLNDKELALFLKYNNELDFDEQEIENIAPEDYVRWSMPKKMRIKGRTVIIDDIITHNFRVINYPSLVGDAWLAGVMSVPGTKVIVKATPMDRFKAVKGIDRSLQELRSRYSATGVDSRRIELQTHIDTLSQLLVTLQTDADTLLETNVYVSVYDIQASRNNGALKPPEKSGLPSIAQMKKAIKRTWSEARMKLNGMDCCQHEAFIAGQISNYDPRSKDGRGMPTNTVAGCYPWIFAHISDQGGIHLGQSDGVPVFIDFFRRDSQRVNSNMVIIGKSGSGKSYATKSLLTNLAAEDAKIFILDPENEYSELASNLHGKMINAGNASQGRLNPFQIITALDDEDQEDGTVSNSFATHLQFLEEFTKQILPDCDKDALEYLNTMIERMYIDKGINEDTDLSKLKPEDYPIFDDLYDVVLSEFERTDNAYLRNMLRTLMNYISKFSTGGRNSSIWNGISTLTTDENFTVFNFQGLLANRNTMIANAQMLLILKYIDNEVIKNKDYNTKYGLKRKIVVVIDEAHVFIDTKFPVALDFMFQLAKRIRKYNGMQIVITQNIKDFVGSEEIARKSTAIINACQYSFIFALAPNDINDLCKLYEKAGGINEMEQEQITGALRGHAFTIMSPTSRSSFKVEIPREMVKMFEVNPYPGYYFAGTQGDANWEQFLGDSKQVHDQVMESKAAAIAEVEEIRAEKFKPTKTALVIEEITEDEYQDSLSKQKEEEERLRKEEEERAAREAEQIDESEIESEYDDSDLGSEDFSDIKLDVEEIEEPVVRSRKNNIRLDEEVSLAAAAGGRARRIQTPPPVQTADPNLYALTEMLTKFSHDNLVELIKTNVAKEVAAQQVYTAPVASNSYNPGTSAGLTMEQIDERIAKAKEEARREALEEVRTREAAEQPSSSLASATYGFGNSSSDDDLPDFYSSILADLDDEEEEPVVQRRSYGDSEDGEVELPDEIYDFSDLDDEDEDPEDDGMYNGDDSDEDSDSDDSEGEDDFDSSDFFSDSDFEDDDDSDDDGEDSHFDIMALLEERASRGDAEEAEEEKIPNPMLTMKEDNVAVVEINLDMLTEYIKSQKGNQRI